MEKIFCDDDFDHSNHIPKTKEERERERGVETNDTFHFETLSYRLKLILEFWPIETSGIGK